MSRPALPRPSARGASRGAGPSRAWPRDSARTADPRATMLDARSTRNLNPPRLALAEVLAGCRGLPADELLTRLRADQSERWRAGAGVPAEEYLAACPELAGRAE